MLNQRHAQRHEFARKIVALFDDDRDQLLGYVLDLGPRGLRIVGGFPIPRGRRFILRLEAANSGLEPLVVEGMGRWAEEGKKPGEYQSGLSFESLTSETRGLLKKYCALAGRSGTRSPVA